MKNQPSVPPTIEEGVQAIISAGIIVLEEAQLIKTVAERAEAFDVANVAYSKADEKRFIKNFLWFVAFFAAPSFSLIGLSAALDKPEMLEWSIVWTLVMLMLFFAGFALLMILAVLGIILSVLSHFGSFPKKTLEALSSIYEIVLKNKEINRLEKEKEEKRKELRACCSEAEWSARIDVMRGKFKLWQIGKTKDERNELQLRIANLSSRLATATRQICSLYHAVSF